MKTINGNSKTKETIISSMRSALYSLMNWLAVLESEIEEGPKDHNNNMAEWIKNDNDEYVCSNCKHDIPFDTEIYYTRAGKIIEWFSEFCPNCGKRMKKI